MEYKLIANEKEWTKYLRALDQTHIGPTGKIETYKHLHDGVPDKYPCIAISRFWDGSNGPYTYVHDFLYYEDVVELVDMREEILRETKESF